MISVTPPALHHALQLLRTPSGARPGPHERLPEGMLLLIRIVAGDEAALSEARQRSEEAGAVVREAAAFYIQQVMFVSGSNSYRLLGVDADAPDERIKEHYRWLVRWLHPDRNPDEWEVIYADRVNRAWQDMRTPERRQRFDEARAGEAASAYQGDPRAYSTGERAATAARHSQVVPQDYEASETGYNALRWLPKLIFGALGVSAVLALGLLWLLRPPAPADEPQVAAEMQDPPVVAAPVAVEPSKEESAATANAIPSLPELAEEELVAGAPPIADASLAPGNPAPSDASALSVPALKPERAKPVAAALPTAVVASQTRLPERPASLRTESPASPGKTRGTTVAVQASRESRRPVASAPIAVSAATTPEVPAQVPTARREVAAAEAGLPAIDDRVANRLVGQLSQAYGDGDLQRMRMLITSNAIGGDGALLDEYDRLFASSEQRSLSISNVSWLQDGDSATIIATYVATVQARNGRRARRTGGDMRLDLRVEGGQWRIYRLSHDDRRG